jgi:hypothetical protein
VRAGKESKRGRESRRRGKSGNAFGSSFPLWEPWDLPSESADIAVGGRPGAAGEAVGQTGTRLGLPNQGWSASRSDGSWWVAMGRRRGVGGRDVGQIGSASGSGSDPRVRARASGSGIRSQSRSGPNCMYLSVPRPFRLSASGRNEIQPTNQLLVRNTPPAILRYLGFLWATVQ